MSPIETEGLCCRRRRRVHGGHSPRSDTARCNRSAFCEGDNAAPASRTAVSGNLNVWIREQRIGLYPRSQRVGELTLAVRLKGAETDWNRQLLEGFYAPDTQAEVGKSKNATRDRDRRGDVIELRSSVINHIMRYRMKEVKLHCAHLSLE